MRTHELASHVWQGGGLVRGVAVHSSDLDGLVIIISVSILCAPTGGGTCRPRGLRGGAEACPSADTGLALGCRLLPRLLEGQAQGLANRSR